MLTYTRVVMFSGKVPLLLGAGYILPAYVVNLSWANASNTASNLIQSTQGLPGNKNIILPTSVVCCGCYSSIKTHIILCSICLCYRNYSYLKLTTSGVHEVMSMPTRYTFSMIVWLHKHIPDICRKGVTNLS